MNTVTGNMNPLTPEQEKKLELVRGLLKKAEATEFADEAEALSAKAAEILSTYSIDAALLAAKADVREIPIDKRIFFEDPYAKQHMQLYFNILKAMGAGDGVLTNGHKKYHTINGLELHVYGFESDLMAVDILYTSLYQQGVTQAARVPRYEHARTYRVSFWSGFAGRIYTRLKGVREESVVSTKTAGTDIVLRDRALEVTDRMNADHDPENRTRYQGSKAHSAAGYRAGQQAGDRANLHNRKAAGQTKRTAIGR